LSIGIKNIIICDTEGAIYEGRPKNMNEFKNKLAAITNREKVHGQLEDVIKGSDIFIGVSVAGALKPEMVKSMNKDCFILALANPVPEILPDEAKQAGAFIVATGRSDFKNQVNNSLAFPGIFKGAIEANAQKITREMKLAAAHAIANLVNPRDLNAGTAFH
jgi:malate dehydrogenase (oxaloacetate-decarboxylating)